MANPLLENVVEKAKGAYFFLEDKYYAVLDKINQYVPIYNVIDPIDNVVPSFLLFIGIVFLLAIFFIFFSFASVSYIATMQVVDNKGNSLEGTAIEIQIGSQKRQLSTDEWGEAKVEIPKQEFETEASFSKEGFEDLNRLVTLYASEAASVTMQPLLQPISFQGLEKAIKVIDNSTNRFITQDVRITFECSSGSTPPSPQEGSTGEFRVTQPSNCPTLIATAESDGYERKSKTLSSETNYIILSPNFSGTTGTIMATVKDSEGNPVPDVVVRAADETTNLEAASSSTSLSGTALLPQLQPGSYTVSAAASDGRTAQKTGILVSAGETTNILITLPSADDPNIKRIYMKLIEQGTSNAIANAQAFIYDSNKLIDSTASDSLGIVEKKLTATKPSYIVVLSHPDFVTKIEPSIQPKPLSDNTPITVAMVRAKTDSPNATAGKIVVKVLNEEKAPVKGALVSIYDSRYPSIPLKSPPGTTIEGGTYTFTNLAPATYFAKATDATGKSEGVSAKKTVAAGETATIELTLVLGKGTVEATVFDAESAASDPIANASVEFIDASDTAIVIAACTTDATGKCESGQIPADRFILVKAAAAGFIPGYANSAIDIVNKNKSKAPIGLVHEGSIATSGKLDTLFAEICEDKECKKPASKVISDPGGARKYFAKLELVFGENSQYKNTVQHIRVGQDSQINLPLPTDYKIKITGVFAPLSNAAVLSKCWNNDAVNPFTEPADCTVDTDAKQANIYYPDLQGRQIVPVIIEFAVEKALPAGTLLELRARAKTTAGAENILTQEKLKLLKINELLCQNNPFIWSFEIEDSAGERLPLDTAPDAVNTLAMNDSAKILYNIYNCGGRAYSIAGISAVNSPIEAASISFTGVEPFDFGPKALKENFSFAADTETKGELPIFSALETPLIALEFSLNAGTVSSTEKINFKIESNQELKVEYQPGKLPSAGTPSLSGRVSDMLAGQAIEGAFATLVIRPGLAMDATTDAAGIFTIDNIEGLQGLSSVLLTVRKAGYKTFEKQIEIGSETIAPSSDIDCVSISKGASNEVAMHFQKSLTTVASDTFTVANNCKISLALKLESELKVAPDGEFNLAPANSRAVTVYAETLDNTFPIYAGEYGIGIMARAATQDVLAGYAGPLQVARVYVTDPNSAFRLADPEKPLDATAMKSSFDIRSGSSEGLIVNKQYVYFEDLSMPKLGKVLDYTAAEDVFSLVFTPPTQSPVEVIKQVVFDATNASFAAACPFSENNCLFLTLIDSAGYVFVNWIDFFMTDEDHGSGERHRVWAQTYNNVWSNITAELPYTLPNKSTAENCITECYNAPYIWEDMYGRKWTLYKEECKTTCVGSPDITYWHPVIDNLGFVDTDVYYAQGGKYDDELTKNAVWQGQHNVCNNNVGTFEGALNSCGVKDYFRGASLTPYNIGHIANKIALEVDGSKTKLSAARFKYTSTDKDHKGLIDFSVSNNTLMGETYALIEAEDTTGTFLLPGAGGTDITVNWAISKSGAMLKDGSTMLLSSPTAIPAGKVLFVSVDGKIGIKNSLNEFSYAEFKPDLPKNTKSIEFTTTPDSPKFMRPEGQKDSLPNIKLYTYSAGGWRQPITFDVEAPGSTDDFAFDPLSDIEVIAIENNTIEGNSEGFVVEVAGIAINFVTRQLQSIELGRGATIIPAGRIAVDFMPSVEDKPLPSGGIYDPDSTEYVIEDTTPEAIVYFTASKSAISPYLGQVTAATSSPEQGSNTTKERFHIRLIGQNQGQCMLGSLMGSTGPGSKPKVLFDWKWDSIDINSCSAGNSNFIYCDPTQFTASLVKRLDKMRQLAEQNLSGNLLALREMQTFDAYLIEDAYTSDFRADFVDFYGREFLSDELVNPAHPWKAYLLDPDRLVFDTANATLPTDPQAAPDSKFVAAGLHEIYIDLEFDEDQFDFFYTAGTGEEAVVNPIASIKVYISKKADPTIKNPFYYLPFNGGVGFDQASGDLKRDGYGLTFANSGEPLAIAASSVGGEFYMTDSSAGSSARKTVGTVNTSSFNTVNVAERGMILSVSQQHDQINFAPSIATPILMQMLPESNKVESYYWLRDETGNVPVSGASFMNLWEAAGSDMRNAASACLDYYGTELKYRVQDRAASSGTCAAAKEGSYGFNYSTISSENAAKRLFFETVFFVPESINVNLRKSCSNNCTFYSPEYSTDTIDSPIPLNSDTSLRRAVTMDEVAKLVEDEYVCISSDAQNFSFWWNPQKILSDLDTVKENIQAGWATELECKPPVESSG